ncbi:hypothetical protein Tsubulata_026721, partial [Turnera subulata]
QPKSTNTKSNNGTIVSLSNHPNPEISCFYQKGFSQITKEATGRALSRFASRVYNTFYGINDPDIISWNSLISANVRSSLFEESLRCFHQMRHVYGQTNSTTLSALLAGCGSAGDLKWGRGLHSLVLKFGLDSNVCLCNTLVGMYSDTGKFKDAELVFKGMADRDVISWNSMLACYAQEGNCQDALKIFGRMFHIDKTANYVTFTSALAACSDPEFFNEGRRAHALAILTGLHDNLIVGNALITLYAKLGIMGEARKIFHRMPRRDLELGMQLLVPIQITNNQKRHCKPLN